MQIDMTSGNPLKKTLAFGAPILAGSALLQLSNLLDSLIVGRVAGVNAFTSIAVAVPVALLVTGFLLGFCNGFLIPIALAVGAGNQDSADQYSCAALIMTALMSILVAIPSAALSNHLIRLVGTPKDIVPDACRYLRVALTGMPILLINTALWGILRAEGNTRTPFMYQSQTMGLHLALDAVLVVGLHMGVTGAACASLIAQTISCVFCTKRVLKDHVGIFRYTKSITRSNIAWKLLSLGAPISFTNLLASASATAFQFAVNSLGSSTVAAVAIADRLFSLTTVPAMLLGSVAEVFSGQNYGANRPDRIRAGVVRLYVLMFGFLVLSEAITIAGSRSFIPLFLSGATPQLIELAKVYLLWSVLSIPFQCASSILKNVLQGIGLPGKAVIASVYDFW